MKRVLLILLAFLPLCFLSAQNCIPDDAYADSTGVFPMPYDADLNPTGGIDECAVIGENYEFVFTVGVGDSITLTVSGISLTLPLDKVVITNVVGLPEGINYLCEPDICEYSSGTIGCAKLTGIPTSANAPGDYDLTIEATISFTGIFPPPQMVTFPDPNLAPGKYTVTVLANASDPCGIVGSANSLENKVSIEIYPNPADGPVNIEINANVFGEFELRVVDLLGQQVLQQKVKITEGDNYLSIDGSQLANGLYMLVLENELGSIAQKMTIQH